jgi:2-polyprenyl-3-methyl-5-hydroxy-6-metoxy-1,4-benzoquinol methylase
MKIKKLPIFFRNIKYSILRKVEASTPQNYWKAPEDYGNSALGHAGLDDTIKHSIFMNSVLKKFVDFDESILEVGCNCGKNLNELHKEGYTNLHGIDISQKAIDLMKELFPDLYYNSNIKADKLEDSLKAIKSDSIDTIFSLTVLMHIHTDSEFIFEEMVRISKKYIVTLEDERCPNAWSHYPRNYKDVFEKLGMKQIRKENVDHILEHHILRIFEKK